MDASLVKRAALTCSVEWMNTFEVIRLDTKTKSIVKCATAEQKDDWVGALMAAMETGALKRIPLVETSISSDCIVRGGSPLRPSSNRPSSQGLERKHSSDVKACEICAATFGISRQKVCGRVY